jgi:hypothetical protein
MKTAITSLMALMVCLTITLAGSNGWGHSGTNPQQYTNVAVNGNGTQVAHYSVTYTDSYFGPVSCTGVHQMGKNFGNGQDSFTCTATPAGATLPPYLSPNQTLTMGLFGGWASDYGNLIGGNYPLAKAFNGVVSSDGKSYTAVANY